LRDLTIAARRVSLFHIAGRAAHAPRAALSTTHTNMPQKTSTGKPRGRPPKSGGRASTSKAPSSKRDQDPFASGEDDAREDESEQEVEEADDVQEDTEAEAPENSIPPELLTRLLHEFFQKDGTRITKDANEAVAKYVDIFVREAIARVATESSSGFFDVSFATRQLFSVLQHLLALAWLTCLP